jgi:hypothetical protein
MMLRWSCRAAIAAFLLAYLGSALVPIGARAQVSTTFGGRAAALQVEVPAAGMHLRLADTGSLSGANNGKGAALLSAAIPTALTGGAVALTAAPLHSAIVAADQSQADASVARLNLTVSGNGISADFLNARSAGSCGTGASVTGNAQVANLVVNNQLIAVGDQINQTIALPNGRIIINEQLGAAGASSAQLTVNVLHITTVEVLTRVTTADIVVASANVQVDCQAQSASILPRLEFFTRVYAQTTSAEFTSGGGWIPGVGGDKATFGFFAATNTDGPPSGHVLFIDHSADFRIESTEITSFKAGCTSTIVGVGQTDTGPADFTIEVHDDGEPGTRDTFSIQATNRYPGNGDLLGGGNVQADGTFAGGKVLGHRPGCST